jgi:hypothetical protein
MPLNREIYLHRRRCQACNCECVIGGLSQPANNQAVNQSGPASNEQRQGYRYKNNGEPQKVKFGGAGGLAIPGCVGTF